MSQFAIHRPSPLRRRLLLATGGLVLATPALRFSRAEDIVEIAMAGTATGSHVWFRPRGLYLRPGQGVRWVNKDAGNVHTTTAYHPDNGKALRIPQNAQSWDSGYLMPDQSFELIFEVPGVYDYYCKPHEQAGMVGRIVVGDVDAQAQARALTDAGLPEAALAQLAVPADIIARGRIDD
ncbi:MAG: plastocyanin/azurin family copper-binding protein [Castellaniella sp.]